MEILILSLAAFLTAIITFFSGFGLGTILMPVFAIFFPIDIAIALTGVVHFINNIFKLVLVGKSADKKIIIHFGIPAILAAFCGAFLLLQLSSIPPVYSYVLMGKTFEISIVKLTIAFSLLIFAILEASPTPQAVPLDKHKFILGGILSGFFGGLSGIQGALRSAFLIRSGLSKESYIATGVVIACLIDFTRLSVYATKFLDAQLYNNLLMLISAVCAALAGAYVGKRFLHKVTLQSVQRLVTAMLIIISIALAAGFI